MSRLVVLVALISVGLAAAVLADVPKCAAGLNVGTVCHIKASNVKPTQFAYGRVASACKAQYIESMSSSKLEKYLSKESKQVPLIVGWDRGLYATDHHHLTRALLDSGVSESQKTMYGVIHADFSALSETPFWMKMIDEGYTWLYDENGRNPFSPSHLAADMNGLRNDYYRSLAYFVRVFGGYGKTETSYSEFLWANWFRRNMPLPWPKSFNSSITDTGVIKVSANRLDETSAKRILGTRAVLDAPATVKWNVCDIYPYEEPCLQHEVAMISSTLQKAIALAKSQAARSLPGWGQGVAEEPNCNILGLEEVVQKIKFRQLKREKETAIKRAKLKKKMLQDD